MKTLRFAVACVVLLAGVSLCPAADNAPAKAAATTDSSGAGDTFANDPTARTWLSAKGVEKVVSGDATLPVDGFLKSLRGQMRLLGCWYKGSQLAASRPFTWAVREGVLKGELKTDACKWGCEGRISAAVGRKDFLDLDLTFRLTDGVAKTAGVAVAFDFTGWSPGNYVLVPASVYSGNRFRALPGGYAPPYPKDAYFNKNAPLMFSDNPRLSNVPGQASKIELLTSNATTPAMCFVSPSDKRGFILLTHQKTRFGNSGLFIEENAAQDRATFVVSAPGVRERAANFGGFSDSGDSGADWKAGDEVSLRFRLYLFPAQDIPALLARFMDVRKSLTGPNHPRNLTPFSAVTDFTVKFEDTERWFEHPTGSFYRCANNDLFAIGWCGGLQVTFPLLALGDDLHRERVFKNMDLALSKMQGKSGYFHSVFDHGKLSGDRDLPTMSMVRKNGDALLWLVKHFMLLKAQGHGDLIKPEWEQAAKRLAQAFVKTWNKNGELGQYVDVETGEIIIFNSTAGAIVPSGLVLASKYFNEPEFLRVAKSTADLYYQRDVVKLGLTGGGCGDISQDADCESAYGFLESLMAIYDATHEKKWLEMARTEAHLGATWTLSYDHEFPAESTLGRLEANMAGAVWASTQNKHAAPGIATTSADYLFKLYRATGESRYAELLRDIQHAHAEVMETPGRPTTGMGPGTSMERITLADGEGKGAIGQILRTSNNWTETNGMLMALEIPGIYLQFDADEFYVFDHIEAEILKREQTGVTVKVTNPTRFPARVSILAESTAQARRPLGITAFLKWLKVEVKPGETGVFRIGKDGTVARQ